MLEQEAYSEEAPAWTVGWSYDTSFRPTTRTLDGDAVAFAAADDSLLTTAGAESLSHDPVTGLLSDVALGDVTTSMTYDAFGDPDSLRYENQNGVLYEALYTRDDLGRIVEKVETTADGQTTTWGYQYDDTGRLEAVTEDGQLAEEYAYDANSNREVVTPGEEVTAVYDDQDRLLAWGDLTFTWDENGDLLSKTDTQANETTQYDYDELGNLLRVDLDDGTVIEYVVDARNRRVGKKVDGQLVQGFAYGDQLNPVAELDGQGNVVARFVYGSRGHVPDYMVKGGNTYRIVSDHLGSVRAVVDTVTGDVVQRLEYDAWGRVLVDTAPAWQPFGFAGGLYEGETGLVRFGVRDYDAEVGRWTRRDPLLFDARQPNLYLYVGGDPQNHVDPEGLISEQDVVDGAAAFGDGISFGLTKYIREEWDVDDVVDTCSNVYAGWHIAGEVVGAIALPGAALKAIARLSRFRVFRFLNKNPYVRIGKGQYGKHGAPYVPRVSIGRSPGNQFFWWGHWRI